jgi:hypothetical protein
MASAVDPDQVRHELGKTIASLSKTVKSLRQRSIALQITNMGPQWTITKHKAFLHTTDLFSMQSEADATPGEQKQIVLGKSSMIWTMIEAGS